MKKATFLSPLPHSFASARATSVLPVPVKGEITGHHCFECPFIGFTPLLRQALVSQNPVACKKSKLTWRPIEQNASWWSNLESVKDFWIQQRKDDHFLQLAQVLPQTTNGLKSDISIQIHWVDVCHACPSSSSITKYSCVYVIVREIHGQQSETSNFSRFEQKTFL